MEYSKYNTFISLLTIFELVHNFTLTIDTHINDLGLITPRRPFVPLGDQMGSHKHSLSDFQKFFFGIFWACLFLQEFSTYEFFLEQVHGRRSYGSNCKIIELWVPQIKDKKSKYVFFRFFYLNFTLLSTCEELNQYMWTRNEEVMDNLSLFSNLKIFWQI